jgi:ribonucleoside-triphosphate reductase
MNLYQQFIHKSRYARYLDEEKRRENWDETVDRYVSFFEDKLDVSLKEIRQAILNQEVMPSMRCMMAAGKALERDQVAGYNCSYMPIDSPRAFDEMMYILMCGTGVGFSVERQFINQLPEVPSVLYQTETLITVRDSKIGWCKAFKELIALLYAGQIPSWDVSKIRPSGARLKTFGGRASGPEPLETLFKRTIAIFKGATGRRLTSIECHDLSCFVGDTVVVGGVRRSALLSLSNLTDERMRHAKFGQWWTENPQRANANNSVCFTERPDVGMFMREWHSLYESRSGERGIFNREATRRLLPERRDPNYEFGTNPCSEIVLRGSRLDSKGHPITGSGGQFCNLSEVVCRSDDTLSSLAKKVRKAAIVGTIQSTLVDFRYLSAAWKKNTEEERLLGVSLTGILGCPALMKATPKELERLKDVAVATNKRWAEKLGIPQSTAVTCVKPSGTVSQLVNSSSGIHAWHNNYFIRRVRNDRKDPVSQSLIDAGVPHQVDPYNESQWVFDFPHRAPKGGITRHQLGAIEHLEIWKRFALHWCEHKPSVTIYVKEDEWIEVGSWVFKNFDILSGVSFLPSADDAHTYQAAPYEDITATQYRAMSAQDLITIDWDSLIEEQDTTIASQEMACVGGACEL